MTDYEKAERIASEKLIELRNVHTILREEVIKTACMEMAEWKNRQLEEYRNNVIKASTDFITDENAKYHSVDEVKEKFIEMIKNIEL